MSPTRVAITGAYGYLGGVIRDELDRRGMSTVALARTPRPGDDARHHDLTSDIDPAIFDGCDALVHCSYDFTAVEADDIWRINVDGSKRLLTAARDAGVETIVTLSSMSAYEGTTQFYGRAKLDIEAATTAVGGCSIRPGLVYGDEPGGMAGALLKLTALPLTPIVGARSHQFLVHEDDLAAAVGDLVAMGDPPARVLGIAWPEPVTFADVLGTFARQAGQTPRFVPLPWRLLHLALRAAEMTPISLPFRSDSLLGLVRPAPEVIAADEVRALGIEIRPFEVEPGRA